MQAIPENPPPLLEVQGVTLQYKTTEHLVTATYRIFKYSSPIALSCLARLVVANRHCSRPWGAICPQAKDRSSSKAFLSPSRARIE